LILIGNSAYIFFPLVRSFIELFTWHELKFDDCSEFEISSHKTLSIANYSKSITLISPSQSNINDSAALLIYRKALNSIISLPVNADLLILIFVTQSRIAPHIKLILIKKLSTPIQRGYDKDGWWWVVRGQNQ
jgi:hypothetical protein